MIENTPVHGCSGCATGGGRVGCPYHGHAAPSAAPAGVTTVMQVQGFSDGAQLCALGYHAWMPWLPITLDDGSIVRYETYCVRCRHSEQFDL